MEPVFTADGNSEILSRFSDRIESLLVDNEFEQGRNKMITLILNSMANSPSTWEETCKVNSEWIGQKFIRQLSDRDIALDKEYLDDVCATCFRFLLEFYLSTRKDLSIDFSHAKDFVNKNIDQFENHARRNIEFAIQQMPLALFKELANSSAIESLKEFNEVYGKADQLKADWEAEIKEKESRVDRLKKALQEYETGFNFVALSHGFEELAVSKTEEKDNILLWMKVLGILLLIPIFAQLIFVYTHLEDISNYINGVLLSIVPTVTLVGIAIYYFRVLLFNYRSVKLQLLQIELRKTLCRFIQSYSDYASEIKEKDSESLSKFENIIFSGIVSEDSELPSTYDGLDQIGKIIASIKN